ncbi:MAG TPA: hypothetical protein VF179_17205 [Thermoanaerobaculia bacterium]|nr:hypothetical protein [Thermoanaerobaculia bacterium]
MDQRYQEALLEAGVRGADQAAQQFGAAVETSKAVIARPLRDIERLASSDRELYPTFYGLTEAESRSSFGDRWDILRRVADAALFPGYQQHIRFAALSLDGVGLDEFGECFLVLREDMIAHRASGFEDNSASFVERRHHPVPEGFRSTWEERSKLCTAKHAKDLQPGTPKSEFPAVLLRQKAGSEESGFVEVHIYGPISVHAVDKVILRKGRSQPRKAMVLELRDRLAKVGVGLEVR